MRFSRQFKVFCLVAISTAMISATAEAQRGGRGGDQRGGAQRGGQRGGAQRGGFSFGGRGGGTQTIGRSTLLRSEDVQKELEMTDAQMDTIKEAMEANRKDRDSQVDRDAMRKELEGLSDEERRERFTKMREEAAAAAAKATKEADAVLEALLEPAQVKRLDEIALQVKSQQGIAALLKSEELRKQLSLTDEQNTKVAAIQKKSEEAAQAAREEMGNAFQRGRGGDDGDGERPDFRALMEKAREQTEENRKKTDKEVMGVLNDEQKSKLTEMKGEPFELDMRSLMGGRGGRGGDDGGRGRGGRGGDDGGRGRGGRGGDDGGRGRGGEDGGRGRGGRGGGDDSPSQF